MKTYPANFLILAAGAVLYILFQQWGAHAMAYLSWIIASVIFCIRVYYNRRKIASDPEVRRRLEEKKLRMQKKWGVLEYVHAKGTHANAQIINLLNVKPYYEMTMSRVTMQLEIDTNGSPIFLVIEREIPNALLPQFVPGSIFSIKYDEQKPENLIFIAHLNPNGKETELKKVYGFE